MTRAALLLAAMALLAGGTQGALAQRQLADTAFVYENPTPAYRAGEGPRIVISTTNSTFVQRGSMDPFARLAEGDGFQVSRQQGGLEAGLSQAAILVIANPFLENFADFPAMEPPSAFTPGEIAAIEAFVAGGGALLLLADHAPLGGGSSDLAKAFGFEFLNGHAANTAAADSGVRRVVITFTPDNGLNPAHAVTDGSLGRARISRFKAFGGQSFIPAAGAVSLLTLPQGWSAIFTYRLEAEITSAMRLDASGMSQGAVMEHGKGRVAVFAETGGFTAQVIDGTDPFGFNTPEGRDNPEFILSVLRWLARHTGS